MRRSGWLATTIVGLIAVNVVAFAAPALAALGHNSGGASAAPPVQIYETTKTQNFASVTPLSATGGGETIYVDDQRTFQPFEGVGAAMTWSSAYNLNRLPATLSRQIIYDTFGRNGASSDVMRVPEGASDFNQGLWSDDDVPYGKTDFQLRHFNLSHEQTMIRFERMAEKANPHLLIIGEPWSPPAWMKTNHSLLNAAGDIGGLIPGDWKVYAHYLFKEVMTLHEAGVNIAIQGILNEPNDINGSYPASGLTPSQEVMVARELRTLLHDAHLATQVYVYDGSWGGYDWAARALAAGDGAAYHCYSGSPTTMQQVHRAFPNKGIIVSECAYQDAGNVSPARLAIESFQNGASAVVGWNLALDDQGGPKTPLDGNCGACLGTATIHGMLVHASPNPALVEYRREFFDYEAFGHFIPVGARRVFSTHLAYSGDSLEESPGIDDVTFTDGRKDVMVLYNNTSQEQTVTISDGSFRLSFPVSPGTTADVIFPTQAN